MLGQPAEPPRQRAGVHALQIFRDPVSQSNRRLAVAKIPDTSAIATRELGVIDAIDRSFFAVGGHHRVAENIDWSEAEKLVLGLRDDLDTRVVNDAFIACAMV